MKRCICNTEPVITCAGMKYYVSCPKCGLATDMYDTLEDAEKAWDARKVDLGKYTINVKEAPKVEAPKAPKIEVVKEKVEAPKVEKVEEEERPYKRRTRREK